jgi:hypothetical protein
VGQQLPDVSYEIGVAGLADVVAVDVGELGEVEAARRLVDVADVEPLDGLLGGEDLGVAVAPAETHEIVAQARRQVAHGAVGLDAERAVALGELGAVGPVDQRHVGEAPGTSQPMAL